MCVCACVRVRVCVLHSANYYCLFSLLVVFAFGSLTTHLQSSVSPCTLHINKLQLDFIQHQWHT